MRRAFTLIELLISMGLMVVLMIGVNIIFSGVGQATSAITILSRITRDAQAAQAVMSQDMTGAVTDDAPFLIIRSERIAAFRNKQDQLGNVDPADPMIEADASAGTFSHSTAIYDARNHRIDRLKFFSRGSFRRQTGNDGTYVDDLGSREAQISYAHLKLYNGTGTLSDANSFPDPGDSAVANPNNLFATQWILGRNAMLLAVPNSSGAIKDTGNVAQNFYSHSNPNLSSLTAGVTDQAGFLVQSSRFDLVSGGILEQARQIQNVALADPNWQSNFTYRFWANPLYLRPLDSYKLSQTTPIFLRACTQFMVEYAGDYLNQNQTTGAIINTCEYIGATGYVDTGASGTDGQIDFIINPTTGARSIRWYGLPRDANGDGAISIAPADHNQIPDVAPLRDIIRKFIPTAAGVPMERFQSLSPVGTDYATIMAAGAVYQCTWGPGKTFGTYVDVMGRTQFIPPPQAPEMLRIVFVLDDPSGRVEGQAFEYVFKLK